MARLPLNVISTAIAELAPDLHVSVAAWRDAFEANDAGGTSWTSSRLTGDGWPLEVVHTLGTRTIGWTAEVAGTRVPLADRLRNAASFAHAPAPITEALLGLQRDRALVFGAWIGMRHSSCGDARKLYAEVPLDRANEATALARRWFGNEPIVPARPATCRMVGYRPHDDTCELYFRITRLGRWELERIAIRAGLPGAADELCRLLSELSDREIGDELPGMEHGFSVAGTPGGPCTLTLFVFARMLGSDVRIRKRIASFCAARSWETSIYDQLVAGSRGTDSRTDHGMLALSIQARQDPRISIGVRVRA